MPFPRFRSSSRWFRPSVLALGAGAALYITYRPRTIPGSESAVVPPPTFSSDGTFHPPKFPAVPSRDENIDRLRASSGLNSGGLLASTLSSASSLLSTPSSVLSGVLNRVRPGSGSGTNIGGELATTVQDNPYDLLIIGGGATGAGIALDAATRGLKVALVERDDFSSGTSSKSTKLVHGGVRYLEKAVWELDYAQYKLVRDALRERRYFLDTAPHLSSWLPIMIPIDKWWKAPYFWVGTKVYDFLAGSENIESSYFLTKSKALDAFPMLRQDNLFGALVYYDGAHNDSRMNVSLAMTAALYGATVVNHMEVTSLVKDGAGKIVGATVNDVLDKSGKNSNIVIRAKGVINATGPFTDEIRQMDEPTVSNIVSPSAGVHVVIPGYFSPSNMGLIDPSTSDGRVVFFLPWQGSTIAGTTDAPAKIERDPIPSEKDIDWILKEINGYFAPEINVHRDDVLAAWSGLRPLVRDPEAKNTEALVRSHLVTTSPSGLVTCSGGKWTTYREMAEDTVDEAIKQFHLEPKPLHHPPTVSGMELAPPDATFDGSCQTHKVRLAGAHGFSRTLFISLIQMYGVETEVAKHLTTAYGDRAWTVASLSAETGLRFPKRGVRISPLYPFVDGEIRYGIRHEYAQTAVDVLGRRTRLAFLNAKAALEALPAIIDIMADELKWDKARQEQEWKNAVAYLGSMGLPEEKRKLTRKQVESVVSAGKHSI